MHKIIRWGGILRDNDDLFVPALWNNKAIIAYSRLGYTGRSWVMPADWKGIGRVDVYRISLDGEELVEREKVVAGGRLILGLPAGEAVVVVPAGSARPL